MPDATLIAGRTVPVPPFPECWMCVEFWPAHDKSWKDAGCNTTLHDSLAAAVNEGERGIRTKLAAAYRVFRLPADKPAEPPDRDEQRDQEEAAQVQRTARTTADRLKLAPPGMDGPAILPGEEAYMAGLEDRSTD